MRAPVSSPHHQENRNETRSRTSDVLLELVQLTQQSSPTLRTLMSRLGDRTFGTLLLLLSVFSALPLISFIAGLLTIIIGLQMMVGMRQAWLPKRLLDWPLPQQKVRDVLIKIEPYIRRLEHYIYPRLSASEAQIVDQINGFVIAMLGCVILIPLPLINVLPALIVLVMSLGLLERDGIMQIAAAALGMIALIGVLITFS